MVSELWEEQGAECSESGSLCVLDSWCLPVSSPSLSGPCSSADVVGSQASGCEEGTRFLAHGTAGLRSQGSCSSVLHVLGALRAVCRIRFPCDPDGAAHPGGPGHSGPRRARVLRVSTWLGIVDSKGGLCRFPLL